MESCEAISFSLPLRNIGESHRRPCSQFWQLPELLIECFPYLDLPDWKSLSLVSHRINESVNVLMYRDVKIVLFSEEYSTSSGRVVNVPFPQPIQILSKALKQKPHLRSYVRSMQILCMSSSHEKAAMVFLTWGYLDIVLDIIKSCEQLKSLMIDDASCFFQPPTIETTNSVTASGSQQLKDLFSPRPMDELEKCILECPSLVMFDFIYAPEYCPNPDAFAPEDKEYGISLLTKLLVKQTFKGIGLTLREGPNTATILQNPLPINPQMTVLAIVDSFITLDTLERILKATPRLRVLSVGLTWYIDKDEAIRTSEPVGRFDSRQLGIILKPFQKTLLALTIRVEYWDVKHTWIAYHDLAGGNGGLWGPVGTIGSLRSFQRLKYLEIAPELLLGWESYRQNSNLYLEDLLPDRLCELNFRFDYKAWNGSPYRRYEWFAEEFVPALDYVGLDLVNFTVYCPFYSEPEVSQQKLKPLDAISEKCKELEIEFKIKDIMHDSSYFKGARRRKQFFEEYDDS